MRKRKNKEQKTEKPKKQRKTSVLLLPCIILSALFAIMKFDSAEKELQELQRKMKRVQNNINENLNTLDSGQQSLQKDLSEIKGNIKLIDDYQKLRPEEQAKIHEFIEFCQAKRKRETEGAH